MECDGAWCISGGFVLRGVLHKYGSGWLGCGIRM